MHPLRVFLSCCLLFAFAAPLPAQEGSWVGKTILPKKTTLAIGYTDATGKDVVVAKLDEWHYPVLAEQDGWLRVETADGKAGWFLKTDAVLLEAAPAYFTKRIQQDPKDAHALAARGTALKLKGEFAGALKDFDAALLLKPGHAALIQCRGHVWLRKKDYAKAIADYDESLRLEPKFATACNSLGWLLATCPEAKFRDGKKALVLAQKACTLTDFKHAPFLDTLAAACAEAGHFKDAVEYQETALKKALGTTVKADYAFRLELYKKNQPYRQGMEKQDKK